MTLRVATAAGAVRSGQVAVSAELQVFARYLRQGVNYSVHYDNSNIDSRYFIFFSVPTTTLSNYHVTHLNQHFRSIDNGMYRLLRSSNLELHSIPPQSYNYLFPLYVE